MHSVLCMRESKDQQREKKLFVKVPNNFEFEVVLYTSFKSLLAFASKGS